jgi:hypothetical protein
MNDILEQTLSGLFCRSGDFYIDPWRPLYFGPSLPSEEIAAAVTYSGAKAVGLSLTNLSDHHRLKTDLVKLRDCLSRDIAIYTGGRIAPSLAYFCGSEDVVLLKDIGSFRQAIETLPNQQSCTAA